MPMRGKVAATKPAEPPPTPPEPEAPEGGATINLTGPDAEAIDPNGELAVGDTVEFRVTAVDKETGYVSLELVEEAPEAEETTPEQA